MLKGIVSVVSDSAETVGNFYLGIGKVVVNGLEGIGESIGEFSANIAHKNVKEEELTEDISLLIEIKVKGDSYTMSHYFRGDIDCKKTFPEFYEELAGSGEIQQIRVMKGTVEEAWNVLKELEKSLETRLIVRSGGIVEIPEG